MTIHIEKITHSAEETRLFASEFARQIKAGDILLFKGDLGVGKTTFIQGLAQGLGVSEDVMTHSPTFTLINEYPGRTKLIHIDLYRIDHPKQLEELGLEDYLGGENILAVEWAEKAEEFWPHSALLVSIESIHSHQRKIVITNKSQKTWPI